MDYEYFLLPGGMHSNCGMDFFVSYQSPSQLRYLGSACIMYVFFHIWLQCLGSYFFSKIPLSW